MSKVIKEPIQLQEKQLLASIYWNRTCSNTYLFFINEGPTLPYLLLLTTSSWFTKAYSIIINSSNTYLAKTGKKWLEAIV